MLSTGKVPAFLKKGVRDPKDLTKPPQPVTCIVINDSDSDASGLPQPSPYRIEPAKSGRARCKRCDDLIPSGSLRVGLKPLFRGKPGFLIWYHLSCTVFDCNVLDKVEDVRGYEALDDEQKKELAHRLAASKQESIDENKAIDPDELVPFSFSGPTLPLPACMGQVNALPYQVEGITWMRNQEKTEDRAGGILADEMGMGKTLQTIGCIMGNGAHLGKAQWGGEEEIAKGEEPDEPWGDALKEWREEMSLNEIRPSLYPSLPAKAGTMVVCPVVALAQWKSELEKFTNPTPTVCIYHGPGRSALADKLHTYDIVLTTYQVLEVDFRKMTSPSKVACPKCGQKYKVEKLKQHLMYFCRVTGQRTERQALQRRRGDWNQGGGGGDVGGGRGGGGEGKGKDAKRKTFSAKRKKFEEDKFVVESGEEEEEEDDDDVEQTANTTATTTTTTTMTKSYATSSRRPRRAAALSASLSAKKVIEHDSSYDFDGNPLTSSPLLEGDSDSDDIVVSGSESSEESEDFDDDEEEVMSVKAKSKAKQAKARPRLKSKPKPDDDNDDDVDDDNDDSILEKRKSKKKSFPEKAPPRKKVRKKTSKREKSAKKPKMNKSFSSSSFSGSDFDSDDSDSDSNSDPTAGIDFADLLAKSMSKAVTSPLHTLIWTRCVLDEAHYIKTRSSGTFKSCSALTAQYRWCLSGTPLQNRVSEFYSLIRFLRIKPMSNYMCKAKHCSGKGTCDCDSMHYRFDAGRCKGCGHTAMQHYSYFNKHVLNPIQRAGYRGDGRRALLKLKEVRRSCKLRRVDLQKSCMPYLSLRSSQDVMDKYMLRRTKASKASDLRLPPRQVEIRYVNLHPAEEDFYTGLYTRSKTTFSDYIQDGTILNNYAHIFDLLMRMRQAVGHPYLVAFSRSAMESRSSEREAAQEQEAGGGRGEACGLCGEQLQGKVCAGCCGTEFCRACVVTFMESAPEEGCNCPSCGAGFSVDLSEKPKAEEGDVLTSEDSQPQVPSHPPLKGLPHVPSTSILRRIPLGHFHSSSKVEAVVCHLLQMRRESPGSKCIVFSQFVNFLDLVRWRLYSDPLLDTAGLKAVTLLGGMKVQDRDAALRAFTTDVETRVLLISLKAGGVALNLTRANHVILCDPWWNPAAEMQAIDRTHRLGQGRVIKAVRLVARGTVEERILELQEKKRLVFDGVVGGDGGAVGRLGKEELGLLFR